MGIEPATFRRFLFEIAITVRKTINSIYIQGFLMVKFEYSIQRVHNLHNYARSPRIRLANCMSFGMMVTRLKNNINKVKQEQNDITNLSMNATKIGILEQPDQVRFRGFLHGGNSGGLEPEISFEILSNFPHQSLERKLAD